ncbi:MAG: BlaI/MecI/CopY family transcriptional regulator [Rhodothermales bacterium]
MKKKSLTPFGETEMEVLQHVWELERASVADVRERILQHRDIAYTTVMTVLKNLMEKGYLDYEKEGNSYIYFPRESAADVQHSVLRSLLKKVFNNSPAALVQSLVKSEELSGAERKQILEMIRDMEDDDARSDS